MRALFVPALAVTAITLGSCQDKKPEPVPGPQSSYARGAAAAALARNNISARRNKLSEISKAASE